jgi:hypothetical protein
MTLYQPLGCDTPKVWEPCPTLLIKECMHYPPKHAIPYIHPWHSNMHDINEEIGMMPFDGSGQHLECQGYINVRMPGLQRHEGQYCTSQCCRPLPQSCVHDCIFSSIHAHLPHANAAHGLLRMAAVLSGMLPAFSQQCSGNKIEHTRQHLMLSSASAPIT